jgi:hypothetical protein
MAFSVPQYKAFTITGLMIAARNVNFPKDLKYVFFNVLNPELKWPMSIAYRINTAPITKSNLLKPQ